jgi:flagellar basal body P-ring protein FlgI
MSKKKRSFTFKTFPATITRSDSTTKEIEVSVENHKFVTSVGSTASIGDTLNLPNQATETLIKDLFISPDNPNKIIINNYGGNVTIGDNNKIKIDKSINFTNDIQPLLEALKERVQERIPQESQDEVLSKIEEWEATTDNESTFITKYMEF